MTIAVEGDDHKPASRKSLQTAASDNRSEIVASAGTATPMAVALERTSREQAVRDEEDAQSLKAAETKTLASTETTASSSKDSARSDASAQPIPPLAIEVPATSPRTQDGTTAPSNGARREPISHDPVVHIGSIEIIIEAPAEPRAAQQAAPARASDFASRHYLRGL